MGGDAEDLHCLSRDRALSPTEQHAFCERISGIKKLVMDTDHSPFILTPRASLKFSIKKPNHSAKSLTMDTWLDYEGRSVACNRRNM